MTKGQRDIVSYGTVMLFSAVLLAWIIPAFSPEYPGYGVPATLVPNIAASGMLLFASAGMLQTLLRARRAGNGEDSGLRIRWGFLLLVIVPCLLLLPAMHYAGFLPPAIAFLAVIQLICGQRSLLQLTIVSVIPALAVWLLMRYGLSVPMP